MRERRRSPRLPDKSRVLFLAGPDGTEIGEGTVRDLSTGGVCVVTGDELPADGDYHLGIFLAASATPLLVRARVVRVRQDEWGRSILGLEFTGTGAARHHATISLADYLEARRQELNGDRRSRAGAVSA